MSTLQQVRQGISKAWDSLSEGWKELRDFAGDALTRFQPESPKGEPESMGATSVAATRWGVLAADVSDSGDRIRVSLEAPGLDPDDLDIEVRDDLLIVRGEKKVVRERRHGHYHFSERAFGRFERAIRLPASVDNQGAHATYEAGVLMIDIPKAKDARPRRIAITARS